MFDPAWLNPWLQNPWIQRGVFVSVCGERRDGRREVGEGREGKRIYF
jgi:hypothetical protein